MLATHAFPVDEMELTPFKSRPLSFWSLIAGRSACCLQRCKVRGMSDVTGDSGVTAVVTVVVCESTLCECDRMTMTMTMRLCGYMNYVTMMFHCQSDSLSTVPVNYYH